MARFPCTVPVLALKISGLGKPAQSGEPGWVAILS